MKTSILKLMAGVAVAGLIGGTSLWAQTESGETEQLQQQMDQGGTGQTEGQAPMTQEQAPEAPTAEQQLEQAPATGEQAEEAAPSEEQATEAPATEQQAEEAAPSEEQATEAPATEGEQDTQAQQQQQQQTQETSVDIDISSEQKTVIKQEIIERDIEPVRVDFEVVVGATIPAVVALHPVPVEVVEVVPEFRGHLHFVLADQRIVIIDPCTMRVVTIIA